MGKFLVYYPLVFPQAHNSNFLNSNFLNNTLAYNHSNSELTPWGNPSPRQARHGQWAMVPTTWASPTRSWVVIRQGQSSDRH